MTQHIDFLPDSHRRKRKRRRTMRWRQSVAVVFLVIVAAGGVQQRRERIRLEGERDRLARQATSMDGQLTDPALLRGRISALDLRAELATHLRLRTPPTRVLYAVTNSLPRFVSLTEFRSVFSGQVSGSKRARRPGTKKPAPAGSAVETDLAKLRKTVRERPLVVTVKGLAADDLSISRFLAKLQNNPTFDEVRLLYTDAAEFEGNPMRGFEIRLQVRRVTGSAPDRGIKTARRVKGPRKPAGRTRIGGNRT